MDAPASEDDLWLARGDEVNPNRPLFTGDVVGSVLVAGQAEPCRAMIVAHPCSMRGRSAVIKDRVLMAPIRTYQQLAFDEWPLGHFGVFPITGLDNKAAVMLDEIGSASGADLERAERLGCLSEAGVNLLQQRLVFRLTRADIPTIDFHTAFSHTYEEADLLEEWTDTLAEKGYDVHAAAASFEERIRQVDGDGPSLQALLREPERRASVRREMRRAAMDLPPATA